MSKIVRWGLAGGGALVGLAMLGLGGAVAWAASSAMAPTSAAVRWPKTRYWAGFMGQISRAGNRTPHADGLAGYDYPAFVQAMREGIGRDGTPLQPPMTLMINASRAMTEEDLQAMFAYLASLPPLPTGD